MKKITILLSIALFPLLSYSQAPKAKDKAAILSIMDRQENCWNKGDLECFMNGYWQSDSLKFIGKSGITYGWQATLDRYKKGYPDRSAMGKLTFTIRHVYSAGKKAVFVIGQWHLKREKDEPQGFFSLLWRKVKGEWVIVADHSS